MFAIAAVIAAALALILHVFTHNNAKVVSDAVLFFYLFVALHLCCEVPYIAARIRRTPPQ